MPHRKRGRFGEPPTQAEKHIFNKRRFTWLDQVMADKESSAAARLAWYVSQDVARTFSSTSEEYSYRSQEGYAELLGIQVRQVRDQFNKLERRGHTMTKRRGKGNPNWTYLTLYDRQKTADQETNDRQETAAQNGGMTGSFPHDDRQSNVIMTGRKLPGNLIEDITDDIRAGQQPAHDMSRASSEVTADSQVSGRASGARKGAPDSDGVATGSHHDRKRASLQKKELKIWRGKELKHGSTGTVTIAEVYPERRRVRLVSQATGEYFEQDVPAHVRFADPPARPKVIDHDSDEVFDECSNDGAGSGLGSQDDHAGDDEIPHDVVDNTKRQRK